MSTEKSNNISSDELQKDFSDVELALDINPELNVESDASKQGSGNDRYDEDYQPVFEEKEESIPDSSSKARFTVANPESVSAGIYDWIRCVIFAVSIVVFCLTFVFRLVEVDGKSMMDTLENSDKVIVTNLFYSPHNNDIIVISHATNYNKPIIKRVIGMEGQTVKLDFENEKVFIDGVELSEPYIKGTTFSGNGRKDSSYLEPDADGTFTVPEGKLFVLGDNRAVSLDSRSPEIGLIDVKDVIGKAQFVVFPFNRFGNVYDK